MPPSEKTHRPPVDTKGAATYTGFTESYLTKIRCTGGGPVFIKRNGVVRYDLDDLDAWLIAGKRKSTSDTHEVAA
ncbi:helix-turn-helix transcriptional regulator [Bradyrhizobium guangzhouense]|uniref:helix-turn-helix transcriptional regulator n=1 Tax=Bradyrhizobium guangzhouense TaxID=1325095 RepID=UPI001009D15B|nr:DNA-binding protein [Bradyrhizobium guangzhouense]RXH15137.1 DNA-binding protein [Bradyrhizobium guangzhouense]